MARRISLQLTHLARRFIDTEAWRKKTNLDELIKSWDYPEKKDVSKYYSQYYHKTDKVCCPTLPSPHTAHLTLFSARRMAVPYISNTSVASISLPCTRSPPPSVC
jgi:hypothetical protein